MGDMTANEQIKLVRDRQIEEQRAKFQWLFKRLEEENVVVPYRIALLDEYDSKSVEKVVLVGLYDDVMIRSHVLVSPAIGGRLSYKLGYLVSCLKVEEATGRDDAFEDELAYSTDARTEAEAVVRAVSMWLRRFVLNQQAFGDLE